MQNRIHAPALQRVSSYAGIAGVFLTLLLGVSSLNPGALPWIAEYAEAIGYVALALFGWAVLGMFKAGIDIMKGTALATRMRKNQARRRVLAEQKRARALHGDELAAWQKFVDAATHALYYSLGVRDERLPLDLAWPWFRHYLRESRARAEALPVSFRRKALQLLERISVAIDREGPVIPTGLQASEIASSCLRLRDWLLECRVRRFIDLYRQCGMEEPHSQDRLALLSAEELKSAQLPDAHI